LYDSPGTTKIN